MVCTSGPTPSLEVEVEAKRFQADPDATVYVVRSGWADTDSRSIETVPQSMVRLRLRAGGALAE